MLKGKKFDAFTLHWPILFQGNIEHFSEWSAPGYSIPFNVSISSFLVLRISTILAASF